MRQDWLIDDEGRARGLGEPGLARSYGSDLEAEVFAAFAVRSMGFVRITAAPGRWRIRLRPQVLSSGAMVGSLMLLAELRVEGGVVSRMA